MGNRLWLAPHFFCCLSEYIVFGRIYGLWFYLVLQYVPDTYCGEI